MMASRKVGHTNNVRTSPYNIIVKLGVRGGVGVIVGVIGIHDKGHNNNNNNNHTL